MAVATATAMTTRPQRRQQILCSTDDNGDRLSDGSKFCEYLMAVGGEVFSI
jgi:hypothetical protein